MNHELLNEVEASGELRITVGTLRNWRCSRTRGPPFLKVGRLVRYRRSDLQQWLETRIVYTSEARPPDDPGHMR